MQTNHTITHGRRALRARSIGKLAGTVALAALSMSVAQAQELRTVTGRLLQVTQTYATIENLKSFRFNPLIAKCYDTQGYSLTCATLLGMGYAERVRLTLSGDSVQRIDILDLQQ
jgi:hypothetical protein